MRFLLHLLSVLLLIAPFAPFAPLRAARPNILFIIADDASRDSFGGYGSPYVKTPGFDRIAREGVLFTEAYNSAAFCFALRLSCRSAEAARSEGEKACKEDGACSHRIDGRIKKSLLFSKDRPIARESAGANDEFLTRPVLLTATLES